MPIESSSCVGWLTVNFPVSNPHGRRRDQLIPAIALGVVLMVTILAGVFAMLAVAIRRDFRDRFARVADKLEHDAFTLVQQILGRD